MNIIKRFFKNIIPSNKDQEEIINETQLETKLGGYDLDDKGEVVSEEVVIDNVEPTKVEPVVKKKPGRPKGSTSKKTPAKKTPAKKTPSKKI